MPFRRTTGIVSNLPSSDPKTEADVIMTAAALGFAASYIEKDQPIQFDMDPLDVYEPEPTVADIATYTHGMIQAIYKAYGLGPSCTPYEIAVGDQTKKMASCLPCTFFMVATGYPPNSIHLGRGESWAPLYAPYNPGGPMEANEPGVIRDLNNAWDDACAKFLTAGLQILDDDHIAADHRASRDAARIYLTSNKGTTVAATLILDAVSMHESETDRINRTLR